MKKIIWLCLALLISSVAHAQTVGEKALLRPRDSGGWIAEKVKNSLGQWFPGNKIKDLPNGTIVEGVYGGNGYWLTPVRENETQAIYYKVEKLIPENFDPKLVAGKKFRYEEYATKFPTHKDKPVSINDVLISQETAELDTLGNVVVTTQHILHPGQKGKEQKRSYTYYGRFMPYCIMLEYMVQNGQPVKIQSTPLFVNAVNSPYNKNIIGIYLSNIHFDLMR